LAVGGDGNVPVPDGLAYVVLPKEALAKDLIRDTEAMQMHAATTPAPEKKISPVVLQTAVEGSLVYEHPRMGYELRNSVISNVQATIRVNNLGLTAESVNVEPMVGGKAIGATENVNVPAGSSTDCHWTFDLKPLLNKWGAVDVQFAAEAGGVKISPLVIKCSLLSSVAQVESRCEKQMQIYPYQHSLYVVPAKVHMADYDGLLIEAKRPKRGEVGFRLVDRAGNHFSTWTVIIPGDDQMYAEFVPFAMVETGPNEEGKLTRLNMAAVTKISFWGLGSDEQRAKIMLVKVRADAETPAAGL
ncbi:MAG TPA: hypothetical protein VG722_12625, partial [Tepidisphaeraceae bacterium]|nr:hypothetical protein [Tepidisphaeraceae bacterium]